MIGVVFFPGPTRIDGRAMPRAISRDFVRRMEMVEIHGFCLPRGD